MAFTFKRVKHTGRWRSFERAQTMIKIKRQEVGYMIDSRDEVGWCVRLAVKKDPTKEDPADFRWIMLRYRGDSEEATRAWLNEHFDTITERYDLHRFED